MDKETKGMLKSVSGLFIMLGLDVLLIFLCGLNLVLGVSCYVYEEPRPSFLICSAVSIGVAGICYWKMKSDLREAGKLDEKWSDKE